MEVRTTINEVIARRICTTVLFIAVSYISYQVGKFIGKREMKKIYKHEQKDK